ncbi:MAG: type II toxin-antitoxin system CcdA family antitoxin [Candidatus Nezhaarchaeales archaeon]
MSRYVTVSTKVRRKLKEEAEKLGIKISELLRRALEEEVRKEKLKRLEEELDSIRSALDRINMDRIVRGIREDRENRLTVYSSTPPH